MKFKLENAKVPIFTWGDSFEDSCFEQIGNLSKLPFAFHHVALMPDGHSGYGSPIGAVFASKGYIVPNIVGVDIGCGMYYLKTNIVAESVGEDNLKHLIGSLRRKIPVGQKVREEVVKLHVMEIINESSTFFNERDFLSNGTIGGGNHFLQFSEDDDGKLSVLIHTGSRNFGKKICDYYNERAKEEMARYFSSVPSDWDLNFFSANSSLGDAYIMQMNNAIMFAEINRQTIAEITFTEIKNMFRNAEQTVGIECKHNYASRENHFGENVWIHRKGAIQAREGSLGIIPGSMGTPSYIVKGLGNKESFCSASHGAGRKMSRTEANKTFSVEEADKSIEGVVYGRWSRGRKGEVDISESPLAYKSIEEVMANQTDLVEIVSAMKPIGVIKE